jgi:hypothetical protein
VLTGLDIEAKAQFAEQQLFDILGGRDRFESVDVRLLRFDRADAPANDQATAHLRITVKDPDPKKVGRAFSGGVMQQALAGYAGFHTTTPPSSESLFGVYRPAAVPRAAVTQTVVLPDGTRRTVADPPTGPQPTPPSPPEPATTDGPTRRVPLGTVCGARSGDKGGNANIGLWTRDDAAHAWLRGFLTPDKVRELLGPETADLDVEVFDLPNLRAVNVLVHGVLGDGVASAVRPDPQAKGLGEYLRSKVVDVPEALLRG